MLEANPQMTNEARVADVGHPDRMMRPIEHEPKPVGRIADTVPIELHARVERLLPRSQRSNEAGEFRDVGFVGAANFDGHRGYSPDEVRISSSVAPRLRCRNSASRKIRDS